MATVKKDSLNPGKGSRPGPQSAKGGVSSPKDVTKVVDVASSLKTTNPPQGGLGKSNGIRNFSANNTVDSTDDVNTNISPSVSAGTKDRANATGVTTL